MLLADGLRDGAGGIGGLATLGGGAGLVGLLSCSGGSSVATPCASRGETHMQTPTHHALCMQAIGAWAHACICRHAQIHGGHWLAGVVKAVHRQRAGRRCDHRVPLFYIGAGRYVACKGRWVGTREEGAYTLAAKQPQTGGNLVVIVRHPILRLRGHHRQG